MKATSETELVKACLTWLRVVPGVAFVWRANTGAVEGEYGGRRRFVRFGFLGCPDILGFMRGGRFFAVECKVGDNKQTEPQRGFQELMDRNGGWYLLVNSLDDLIVRFASRGCSGKEM